MNRFILFLCFFVTFFAKAQFQYKSIHFTADDGLPSNIIYSITEDKNGNIILGTDNGLSVFNGTVFKNYKVNDGLYNPYIVSVFNSNDLIYLVNYNGKLQTFQNNKIRSTPLFIEYMNQLLVHKNALYFYSMQSRSKNKKYTTAVFNKLNFKAVTNDFSTNNNRILPPILMQNDEEILIKNDCIFYKKFKIKIPAAIKEVHKIIFRKTDVCVLDDDFLYTIDFNAVVLSKIKLPANLSAHIIFKHDFIVDKLDNCWLSIQNQGLFILKSNNWVRVNQDLGLKNQDNINFLYNDTLGKLWIATNEKGLFCIPSVFIQTLFIENTSNYFNGFAATKSNKKLLFSSKLQLYAIDKQDQFKLVQDSKSELSLCNFDSVPIVNSQNAAPYFFYKNAEYISLKGKQFIEKSSNHQYISLVGNNAIIIANQHNNNTDYKQIANKIVTKEKIRKIIKYNNKYYFNTGQSIDIRSFDNKFIYHKKKLNFKINGFIEDFVFNNDTLLIAANNAIYKIYNEKIIDSIISINNVRLQNVNKIVPLQNTLFLCASNGLFKIDSKKNVVFNKYNFLPANEVYNVIEFNSNLFVATNNGIAKISTTVFNNKSPKPICTILYNEVTTSKIALKSTIAFATVKLNIQNFNAAENQIIQYKFDDSKWFNTKNKSINFQSVSFGNHFVAVRIKDVNSDWSVVKFQVYRQYPFYLKWWFIALLILALAAAIYKTYQHQISKIKAKQLQETAVKNQIIELRQNALSAMMNPHFIFNSLNVGQFFINSNQPEKSSDHLAKLARLVRLFLSQSAEPFISIDSEMKRLKLYAELEQARFNNFKFDLDIDKSINVFDTKIPNMIVQPFIENAILHGISDPEVVHPKILVKFSKTNNGIIIEIIDNGFGIVHSAVANADHVSRGIAIIKERLVILQKLNPGKTYSISQEVAFLNQKQNGHKVLITLSV